MPTSPRRPTHCTYCVAPTCASRMRSAVPSAAVVVWRRLKTCDPCRVKTPRVSGKYRQPISTPRNHSNRAPHRRRRFRPLWHPFSRNLPPRRPRRAVTRTLYRNRRRERCSRSRKWRRCSIARRPGSTTCASGVSCRRCASAVDCGSRPPNLQRTWAVRRARHAVRVQPADRYLRRRTGRFVVPSIRPSQCRAVRLVCAMATT